MLVLMLSLQDVIQFESKLHWVGIDWLNLELIFVNQKCEKNFVLNQRLKEFW